jgi:excisionase family DNA binding protein
MFRAKLRRICLKHSGDKLMREPIDQDRAVEKIVDAFRLLGELLGYAIAYRLAAESQGAAVRMPTARGPLLMSLKQAADYLGMGKTSLGVLASQGKIPRVYIGGRPKFRACDLDQYVRSQNNGAGGVNASRAPERRDPSRRTSEIPRVARPKGLTRKPNDADRYAARTYGLDLRALKVSGNLLQEILHIDAKQYKSWAYEGGELPASAKETFDSWCAGYVKSIRNMYPDGSDFLIDPATPLV